MAWVLSVSVDALTHLHVLILMLLASVASFPSTVSTNSFNVSKRCFSMTRGVVVVVLCIACIFCAMTSLVGVWTRRMAILLGSCAIYAPFMRGEVYLSPKDVCKLIEPLCVHDRIEIMYVTPTCLLVVRVVSDIPEVDSNYVDLPKIPL